MTSQALTDRGFSRARLLLLAAGGFMITVVFMFVFAESAFAHGYVTNSRAHLCSTGVNVNCGAIRWEPYSVEGRGDFPEIGVPDGTIASGGGGRFAELDEQTATRWAKVDMTGGVHTFHWSIHANHSTNRWDYYITKKGWDPNAPLKRADLELFCTYIDDGAIPPDDVYHDCFIPNDRSGYYVILAVWDIADTPNAFYQVIDVNLSINPNAPTVPEPGFPGDPDRFPPIPYWNPIKVYVAGDIVIHNGMLWEALWWTQNQEPGTTGEWGPWRLIGPAPEQT
jgi:chitin-binding protein